MKRILRVYLGTGIIAGFAVGCGTLSSLLFPTPTEMPYFPPTGDPAPYPPAPDTLQHPELPGGETNPPGTPPPPTSPRPPGPPSPGPPDLPGGI